MAHLPTSGVTGGDSQYQCRRGRRAYGFRQELARGPPEWRAIQEVFAESCNTSFIYDGFHYLVHGDSASVLRDEARDVFGLGSWSIGGGVQTADPSIPGDPQGSDKAAQFIGQGQVTMSPLTPASLAATVRDGAFHQPVILPNQSQAAAPQQISVRARTAPDMSYAR